MADNTLAMTNRIARVIRSHTSDAVDESTEAGWPMSDDQIVDRLYDAAILFGLDAVETAISATDPWRYGDITPDHVDTVRRRL